MNILYIIYNGGTGVGGHHHSLYNVVDIMSRTKNVFIFSIGNSVPKLVSKHPAYIKNLHFGSFSDLSKTNKYIYQFTVEKNIDIIHCFDGNSFNIIYPLLRRIKIPVVLSKCGGPNSKNKIWQIPDSIVLQSQENYNWFESNIYYTGCNKYLIPNRLVHFTPNKKIAGDEVKSNNITFVRINRIGERYKKTMIQSINLMNSINPMYKVELIIIGVIEDIEVFEEIKKYAVSQNIVIKFITDQKRVYDAKNFLYLADYVIGTGRSLMEAMSLSIPVFTPVSGSKLPVFVSTSNFENLLMTNFSERNTISEHEQNHAYNEFLRTLESPDYYNSKKEEIRTLYKKYLDINGAIEKYSIVYDETIKFKKPNRNKLINRLINFGYFIKYVIINNLVKGVTK